MVLDFRSVHVQNPGNSQSVYVSPVTATGGQDNTYTFTQAAHGFDPLTVVSFVGNTWARADKNGPLDIFVIVAVPDPDHFTVSLGGRVNIAHSFGAVPINLYLGDDGQLTITPPVINQTPRQQLFLATVIAAGVLWIRPDSRAW
jgi:hypothetical protein